MSWLSDIRVQSQKLQNDSSLTIMHGRVPPINMGVRSDFQQAKVEHWPIFMLPSDILFFNFVENQRFQLDSSAPLLREIIINQQQSQYFCPRYTFSL